MKFYSFFPFYINNRLLSSSSHEKKYKFLSFVFTTANEKLLSREKYSVPVDDVGKLTNTITNGATSAPRKERGQLFSDVPLNRVSTTPLAEETSGMGS